MNLRGRGVFAAGDSIRARLFNLVCAAKMEKRDVFRKFLKSRSSPGGGAPPVIPSEEPLRLSSRARSREAATTRDLLSSVWKPLIRPKLPSLVLTL
jgi:hypothetical protein